MAKKKKSERRKANSRIKEQKRNSEMNQAFAFLQSQMPFLLPPTRQKVPKIKLLRLAQKYILHLNSLLQDATVPDSFGCRPLRHEDFQRVAQEEMSARNSYTERIKEEEENDEGQGVHHRAQGYSDHSQPPPLTDPFIPPLRPFHHPPRLVLPPLSLSPCSFSSSSSTSASLQADHLLSPFTIN